jgi:hypothetical protein
LIDNLERNVMAGLINNTDTTIWVLISGQIYNLNRGGQIGGTDGSSSDVEGYWYNGTFYGIDDNWFGGISWYYVSGGDNGSVTVAPYSGPFPPPAPGTLTKGSPSNSYTVDNPYD